jgi:hypothetical protein
MKRTLRPMIGVKKGSFRGYSSKLQLQGR